MSANKPFHSSPIPQGRQDFYFNPPLLCVCVCVHGLRVKYSAFIMRNQMSNAKSSVLVCIQASGLTVSVQLFLSQQLDVSCLQICKFDELTFARTCQPSRHYSTHSREHKKETIYIFLSSLSHTHMYIHD